jgi:hypothetical protein
MTTGVRAGLSSSIETPGLDEMIARLQAYAKIGDTDARRVRAGMRKVVNLAYARIDNYAPFRSGNLKATMFKHVQTWPEGNVSGTAGFGAAKLTYHGKWAGMVPFVLEGGRQANNNGRMVIKPMQFMLRAKRAVESGVIEIFKNVAKQITEDLAGKAAK